MLISEPYRQLNAQLHHDRPDYGTSGHRLAALVHKIATSIRATSILDYGAGKCTLRKALPQSYEARGYHINEYDPAFAHLDRDVPADLVVCGDVLEHVEPDCLDAVLDRLAELTLQRVLLLVATRPAKKTLADGRNAHLIVHPLDWWLPKLDERWHQQQVASNPREFVYYGARR